MLIDTHCHLNFSAFKEDADKVIEKTLKQKIAMIVVGTQYDTSLRAIQYANKYEGVYASIGLHPIHIQTQKIEEKIGPEVIKFVSRAEKFNEELYENLLLKGKRKVVAVGEIGLDYHDKITSIEKETQKEQFIKQIRFAKNHQKPIMIHSRNALEDILEILRQEFGLWKQEESLRGVCHFYSGTLQQAEKLFALGFLVSFTGVITFAPEYELLIKNLPLEKIMIETDAPYVSPAPYRGKRNEPANVKFIAQKIADIKGISFKEVARQTTENAKKLFKI